MPNNVPTTAKQDLITKAMVTRAASVIALKLSLMLTAAGNARDAYSATNESTATGYTAGGYTIAGATSGTSGTKGYFDCTDVACGTLTGAFQYADLYDNAQTPKQVFVTYDLGSQNPSGVSVTIQWPTPDSTNAMFRIA
jgi:hypothetical protein